MHISLKQISGQGQIIETTFHKYDDYQATGNRMEIKTDEDWFVDCPWMQDTDFHHQDSNTIKKIKNEQLLHYLDTSLNRLLT